MNIFDLHSSVLADYCDFVRSFFLIADERARAYVDRSVLEAGRLWPDFLLQLSPSYVRAETVDDLARRSLLHEEAVAIFRTEAGQPFRLYKHQVEAMELARAGQSYVVTSGTGSGKSLTYFLPIIDSLLRQPPAGERVVALVVYPMNALVNSQLQALEGLKSAYERRTGKRFPATFARYTGEATASARDELGRHPPQIMLTNYMMAELMLVRPEDQRFLDKVGGGVRFLVFDELHTYRGRQGADVAMLIRRLKERCAAPSLIHVGTSATMVTNREATPQERRSTVAEFAQRLFGHPFAAHQIVEETLEPFTVGGEPTRDELKAAVSGPLPATLDEFRRHPLARWVEQQFGIEREEGGRFKRRVPQTLAAAAQRLAEATDTAVEECAERLRALLNRGSELACDDGGRAFAFKLHQFIGQGRALFATLEPSERREFSLEGQLQAGSGRIFAPIKFCRQCGQDYYHVLRSDKGFRPHPVGIETAEEDLKPGYLMLASEANDWGEDRLPEEWRDAHGRLTRTWRDRVPTAVWVAPDGDYWQQAQAGAVKMWWQPSPFSLCLACGEYYTAREREFAKLATLSSEARSSATTVLATALLRHAASSHAARDKLLTFTDNRQDASLQAGHFNDFIHVCLLRSALYAALVREQELTFDRVAAEVVACCGLTIRDIARNAELDPQSPAAQEAWRVFTDLTEYRLYEDLRRGWRVVQPNLEQVGLLRVGYRGLEALCADHGPWAFHRAMAALSPSERETIVRAVLDHFRRKLAISCRCLEETVQQQIRRRSEQNLNEFWGIDPEVNELRAAARFVLSGRSVRRAEGFSLNAGSALGKFLCGQLDLDSGAYQKFVDALLALLVSQGLLIRLDPVEDHQVYQLDAACLLWRLGDGSPPRSTLFIRVVPGRTAMR